MPHTYVRRSRIRPQNMRPVGVAQQQAGNPYRMHGQDPLVNGVANAAAALFRAPQERAQIEMQRGLAQRQMDYQHGRDTQSDIFRGRELDNQQAHFDAMQAHWAAMNRAKEAGAAGRGAGTATLPAFKRTDVVDSVTGKITHTEQPWSDEEIGSARRGQAMYQGKPITRAMEVGRSPDQMLGDTVNPNNDQPLGPNNPYQIPKPADMQAHDQALQQANSGAAGLFAPPAAAAAAPASPAALFGPPAPAPAAADPHAVDPRTPPEAAGQVQAISKAVSQLHPDDQAKYGLLLKAAADATASGDQTAIQTTHQKLMTANQRLLGAAPAPTAPAPAASAPRTGLGVMPSPDVNPGMFFGGT